MFWLWNELFGFPVNSCDYEAIDCNKSYVPILNWDNDNEFVWSLADPLEWGVDASNVSFNTKNPQKWPSSISKVDQALERLMDLVMNKKSTLESFTLSLKDDGETLEWVITYIDDAWNEYSVPAEINIKNIVEGWETLTLQDVTLDNLVATEASIANASITIWVIANETVGTSNITTATIWTETVTNSTIENLTAENADITTLDVDHVTVNEDMTSNWEATFNGVNHFVSDIDADNDVNVWWATNTRRLNVSEVTTLDWQLNANENAIFAKNVKVEWNTSLENLAVNAYATFNDKSTFNEDATFNDTLVANSNAVFNWHTDVDTFHAAGQATFWDDVDIDFNLNVDWNAVVEWNARVDWSLSVAKNSEFKKNLTVKWSEIVEQNLEVTGKTTTNWLDVLTRASIANEDVDNSVIKNLTVTDSFTLPDWALDQFQARSEKDQANWYAGLDANGKLAVEQLPDDIANGMHYRGTWDPVSDYPANPKVWDMWKVIADWEKSDREFHVGDAIIYNGTSWDLIPSADDVISVNGRRWAVTGLEESSNKINIVNKNNPSADKYISEVAAADMLDTVDTVAESVDTLSRVVATKANSADVYTKVEADQKMEQAVAESEAFQALEDVVATKAWKDYVDWQLNLKANVADVYDKDTMDAFLADKAHITHTHTIAEVSWLSQQLATHTASLTALWDEIDDLEGEVNGVKWDIVRIDQELENKADLVDGKIPADQLPDTAVTVDQLPAAISAALTQGLIEAKLGVSFRTFIVPLMWWQACKQDPWINQRANVLWTWSGDLQWHITWTVDDWQICVSSNEQENGNFYITLVQQA